MKYNNKLTQALGTVKLLMHFKTIWKKSICVFSIVFVLTSCEKFVDIPISNSYLGDNTVFGSNETSISFATGMYNKMIQLNNFASGSGASITFLGGLSSDELVNNYTSYLPFQLFYKNNLIQSDGIVLSAWSSAYNVIYQANILLEGLPQAKNVSSNVKSQLLGEAYFVRAFCHFYLVNIFGDIPVVTTTDYSMNARPHRTPVMQVYQSILSDLKEAERLMKDAENGEGYTYVTTERVRANSWAAKFLQARTYLFAGDWTNAEALATSVINKNDTYSILTDLNNVFKANNNESIWQLKPMSTTLNTFEGGGLIIYMTPGTSSNSSLTLQSSLLNDFESGDQRKVNWIGNYTNSSGSWNYAFKYKIRIGAPGVEYSVVFRLAEMYLVRAEARAKQNKLGQAIQDLDVIRNRAGLSLIQNTNPGITQDVLLDVILHERRVELFTEWGHRWLDLKRTGKANQVLSVIKGSDWQTTDQLFPIPEKEILNGGLSQNPGY